jgi:hypothetical protein
MLKIHLPDPDMFDKLDHTFGDGDRHFSKISQVIYCERPGSKFMAKTTKLDDTGEVESST